MTGFDVAWAKYHCARRGHLWSAVSPGGPLRCSRCGRIDEARVWAAEMDNARYRGELRARRECLVGAKQTLEMVFKYLDNDALPEPVYYQRFPIQERIELVDQAIASTDAILGSPLVEESADA